MAPSEPPPEPAAPAKPALDRWLLRCAPSLSLVPARHFVALQGDPLVYDLAVGEGVVVTHERTLVVDVGIVGERVAILSGPGMPSALSHWMISSARTSTDGGIVRPSALAVFRLMTSSNLIGCWTGRSAGLAPFRILST